eukprot:1018117-Rhodomonas_salina.1
MNQREGWRQPALERKCRAAKLRTCLASHSWRKHAIIAYAPAKIRSIVINDIVIPPQRSACMFDSPSDVFSPVFNADIG